MAKINIKGDIIGNKWKKYYDFFKWDSTCPRDVQDIIDTAEKDEPIDVYINSPGGIVEAGQEIYTALRGDKRVKIHITGQACSAASFIAMAGHSDITPVGLLMVHCASSDASGNHKEMERAAEALRAVDRAIAEAYAEKSGMSLEEAIQLMENETWLPAKRCVELKLIDEVTQAGTIEGKAAAAVGGVRLTQEMIEQADRQMKEEEDLTKAKKELLESLDSYGA